jgi:hypothetical protein
MEKRMLCPACESCPEVVFDGDTIRVGETAIKKAAWNGLVDAIKSGKSAKV